MRRYVTRLTLQFRFPTPCLCTADVRKSHCNLFNITFIVCFYVHIHLEIYHTFTNSQFVSTSFYARTSYSIQPKELALVTRTVKTKFAKLFAETSLDSKYPGIVVNWLVPIFNSRLFHWQKLFLRNEIHEHATVNDSWKESAELWCHNTSPRNYVTRKYTLRFVRQFDTWSLVL